MTQSNLASTLPELTDHLEQAEEVVVLTGAGISVASGIEPFRKSADAIWERDVTELATRRFFNASPLESWLWYLNRFDTLTDKQPNPAHDALTELESWCEAHHKRFTLVTQNIDTLHRKAGSQRCVEIHGRADAYRCTQIGCKNAAPRGVIPADHFDLAALKANPSDEGLPRCPECGSLVRPHILWFDERYDEHEGYQFERALRAFDTADVIICIGTSFSVGITELALGQAHQRFVDFWVIDPSIDRFVAPFVSKLERPAEEALPDLMSRLKKRDES